MVVGVVYFKAALELMTLFLRAGNNGDDRMLSAPKWLLSLVIYHTMHRAKITASRC